jgi:hypothetical protein
VLDSEFAWLGMNAVASLGRSEQDDATGGEQPWGTLLSGLVARELALWEKQSSAYFVGRTPLSRLEASLFYNGPRAMVNVNDHLGGGNNFTTSVMLNTCRESGDHGGERPRGAAVAKAAAVASASRCSPALSKTTHLPLPSALFPSAPLSSHEQLGSHALPAQHCQRWRRGELRASAFRDHWDVHRQWWRPQALLVAPARRRAWAHLRARAARPPPPADCKLRI